MTKLTWQALLAASLLTGCTDVLGLKMSTAHDFKESQDADITPSPDTATASADTAPASVDTAGPPSTANGVTIHWMSNGTTSSFFDTSRSGANLAAQELTNSSGMNVNLSITDPANNQAATQAQRIRDAIAARVNAIAIDVIDATVIGPEIDAAANQGITVLTFDSDAPGSKRISYYSIDNYASGVVAAKILTSLMGSNGGNIAIMNKENPPTAANFMARRDGFVAELEKHAGFKVVTDLPCTDGPTGESTLQAGCTGVLESAMAAHPEITGWFLSRGRILRETDLATKAPNWTAKIKSGAFFAVSYDAIPESLANIQAGYVNAVINQKYFGWGYDVVKLLFDIVTKKRSSINPFTDSGFDIVCANNIGQVSDAWTRRNFSKPIDKCALAGQQWP